MGSFSGRYWVCAHNIWGSPQEPLLLAAHSLIFSPQLGLEPGTWNPQALSWAPHRATENTSDETTDGCQGLLTWLSTCELLVTHSSLLWLGHEGPDHDWPTIKLVELEDAAGSKTIECSLGCGLLDMESVDVLLERLLQATRWIEKCKTRQESLKKGGLGNEFLRGEVDKVEIWLTYKLSWILTEILRVYVSFSATGDLHL